MRRLLLITALFTLASAVADAPVEAQRRMRSRVVSAPAGTQVVRATPSGTVTGPANQLTSGTPVTTGGNSAERLLTGDYPAPGLGFDYTHHAAVNRNLATRALVDPITQHRLALERDLRRGSRGAVGPAFPVVVNSIIVNVVPQPPVVIIQEPEPQQDYLEHARYRERGDSRIREDLPLAEAPAGPRFFYEPPQRDGDDLVFIRRDGSLVFAVAYTARDGRITYITREGHRRSIAIADLDLPATRDINEARGSSVLLR